MKRSETIGSLAAALAKAQGRMQHARKDAENPHFRSRYADLAAIIDASREALAAEELSVLQFPSTPEPGIVALITMLLHSSSEWVESDELRVQARDAGPQAVGSCLTYLRRYQLSTLIGIAPDADDDDGEAAEPPPGPRAVVNRDTGEELTESDIFAAPAGFHHVRHYTTRGDWHEATILNWTADGRALKVSTKLLGVGKLLAKAAERDLPIKPGITMKKDRPDEAYLNSVVFYDAEQPDGDRG
jgi:hypothetical protein